MARLSRPAQQPGNNDLPGRSVAVAAVAKTSSKPSSVVGDDHAGSGTDDATLAAEVGGEQEKSTDEAPAIAAVSVVVGAAPSASSPSAEGPSVTTTPVTPVTAAPPVDGSASTAVNAPEHASNLSGISALKPKLLEDAVNAAAEGRGRDGNNSPESLPREQAAATVPRSAWLRVLRQAGSLRRKAMASDALRPILTDGDFTKVRCRWRKRFAPQKQRRKGTTLNWLSARLVLSTNTRPSYGRLERIRPNTFNSLT